MYSVLKLVLCSFLFLFSFSITAKNRQVVAISLKGDGGLWSDRIIQKIRSYLDYSDVNVNLITFSWTSGMSDQELTQQIKFINPEVVIYGHEFLYTKLSRQIFQATKSHAITINGDKSVRLNQIPAQKQHFIHCETDLEFLLNRAALLLPDGEKLRKVGIVAYHVPNNLILSLKNIRGTKFSIKKVHKWSDYIKTFHQMEESEDAIIPIFPLTFSTENRATIYNYKSLLYNSKVMTIGYKKLYGVARTIDYNLSAVHVAKYAKSLVYQHLSGKSIKDRSWCPHSVLYDHRHRMALNLKLPDGDFEFIPSRGKIDVRENNTGYEKNAFSSTKIP